MLEENQGWEGFLNACLHAKNKEKLNRLFKFLFTPEEREQMATRILVTKELLQETKTQREIAKDLKISIAKITRGSNNLKELDTDLKNYLRKEIG